VVSTKLHSPIPYFLLTACFGLVPVLNNKYPAAFFPSLSPGLVELLAVGGGIAAAALGFGKGWARLVQRDGAVGFVRQAVENRKVSPEQDQNEVVNAGRIISRLVRNADEDLREINPDFSLDSLRRLQGVLPELLAEIQNPEDALIRTGVAGIYLGEVLCRQSGWQWFFRADASLKQFSYMASVIRKGGGEMDPFAWAGDLLTGKRKVRELLKENDAHI
jgi:hypothetical protein